MAKHIHLGQWGEEVACKYLRSKGYTVLDRNFRRKWGEIDIICSSPRLKSGRVRGVVDRVNISGLSSDVLARTGETLLGWLKNVFNPQRKHLRRVGVDKKYSLENLEQEKIVFVEVKTLRLSSGIRPEDNITRSKQKKLIRSCQLYISQKKLPINTNWQIDVIGVLLDKEKSKARVSHIERAVYFN